MERTSWTVSPERKIRCAIISDAAAEGDDAFAIAHTILSPRFDIQWISGCHYGGRSSNESKESLERIKALFRHMRCSIKLVEGAGSPGDSGSDACRMIIEEAMKKDSRPFYLLCMGALTDLAAALKKQPDIAERMTAVWTGGAAYPDGGPEFNIRADTSAASTVFGSSLPFYQITNQAYLELGVSFTELELKLTGPLGRFLLAQLHSYADSKTAWSSLRSGETWTLGDNAVPAVLLHKNPYHYTYEDAREVNADGSYGRVLHDVRKLRVYSHMDSRLILEDFFAKVSLHDRKAEDCKIISE